MSGYRFCRSDDIALLVRAHNECYVSNFPDVPAMTVDDFKRGIRELNLWTSSCMVAVSGDELIGVLLAAKRETENWIYRLAIRPDHQREGHGSHLLTSLTQKLAILGPRRILVELPETATAERRFFEACGFAEEQAYTDFVREPGVPVNDVPDLVTPIGVDELLSAGALDDGAGRCWARSTCSLRNVRERLQGLAIASEARIEAYLIHEEAEREGARNVVACGAADPGRAEPLLGLLFGIHAGRAASPVRLAQVAPDEISFSFLERLGFRAGDRTLRYATEAEPG